MPDDNIGARPVTNMPHIKNCTKENCLAKVVFLACRREYFCNLWCLQCLTGLSFNHSREMEEEGILQENQDISLVWWRSPNITSHDNSPVSSRSFTAVCCAGNQTRWISPHWDFKDLQCRMQNFYTVAKREILYFLQEIHFPLYILYIPDIRSFCFSE